MKKIQIFVASSDELHLDRTALGNLVRKLDDIYERWGIRIKVFEWEDHDAAFNDRRKQDEYNEHVKESDMFVSLFHTKAGRFTREEFDVALDEYRKKRLPKVYAYCKVLSEGESETPELEEFKRRLYKDLGHYWCNYQNEDALQLHFVLQLQLVESGDVPKVEVKDGEVVLDGFPVARMGQLQFAACNEEYQRLAARLDSTLTEMDRAARLHEKEPDNEELALGLQKKTDEYNRLKEECEQLQKALIQTATRIAEMEHRRISDRARRAIEAFENGQLSLANSILGEATSQIDEHMRQLSSSMALVHEDIELLRLHAKILLSDFSIGVEERKSQVLGIYQKAVELAAASRYDEEEALSLLDEYGDFCSEYGYYKEALDIYQEYIRRCKAFYEKENEALALGYESLAYLYEQFRDRQHQKEYLMKSLEIRERLHWKRIAVNYIKCANFSLAIQEYGKAEDYLEKAEEAMAGSPEYRDTDWAHLFDVRTKFLILQGRLEEALEVFDREKVLLEKGKGEESMEYMSFLVSYGQVYVMMDEYERAVDLYRQVLDTTVRLRGPRHRAACVTAGILGVLYANLGDAASSEKYLKQSLSVGENLFGEDSNITPYLDFVHLYLTNNDYGNAEKYLEKCGAIINASDKNVDAVQIGRYKTSCGQLYSRLGDYPKAMQAYGEALAMRRGQFGDRHIVVAGVYVLMAGTQLENNDIAGALVGLKRAQEIYDSAGEKAGVVQVLGLYEGFAKAFMRLRDYKKTREYCQKALAHIEACGGYCGKAKGAMLTLLASVDYQLGHLEKAEKEYNEALGLLYPGAVSMFAVCKYGLGQIMSDRGDHPAAKELFSAAKSILAGIQTRGIAENRMLAYSMLGLGNCNQELKEFKEAEAEFESALRLCEECGLDALAATSKAGLYNVRALLLEGTYKGLKYSIKAAVWAKKAGKLFKKTDKAKKTEQ